MTVKRPRPQLRSLLLICLQLAIMALLVQQLISLLDTTPRSASAVTAARVPALALSESSPPAALPEEARLLITQLPLFNISRKPVRSLAEKAPAAVVNTDLAWRLSGIVNSSNVSIAIFITDDDSRSLKTGMELDGWTLSRINADSVTLEQNGQQLKLPLETTAGES